MCQLAYCAVFSGREAQGEPCGSANVDWPMGSTEEERRLVLRGPEQGLQGKQGQPWRPSSFTMGAVKGYTEIVPHVPTDSEKTHTYELLAGGSMSQREDVAKFEQLRIKALQEERLHIQKKTFTKWMNSFLQKARMEVEDLFTDLADGKKLLKLLEIISGEKLGKPNNGKMRVHKVENVNKSLAFLSTK
ncbi:hypothetical protein FOCC_FOCC003396, partial [Frankliniella occidentalis]